MNGMSRCDSEHMVERSGMSWCPMAKVSKRKLAERVTSLRRRRNKGTYDKERIKPKTSYIHPTKVQTRVRVGGEMSNSVCMALA